MASAGIIVRVRTNESGWADATLVKIGKKRWLVRLADGSVVYRRVRDVRA